MSDKDIYKECAATSTATLEEYITNPCIPKNENEWWASREIERLRAENDKLKKELDFAIKGVEKYEAIIDAAKEQAKDDLSKKLREANGYLFRDWKENARLMWQAAEEIEKLDDTRIDYICKINKLVDERAKLHKALLYVYDNSLGLDPDKMTDDIEWVTAEIRAAREALEDK